VEKRAMPITPFLNGERFDLETRRVLGVALEMTCIALRTGDCDDSVRQAIAIKIIELAKAGERNPDVLCEQALAAISLAAGIKGRLSSRLVRWAACVSGIQSRTWPNWDPIFRGCVPATSGTGPNQRAGRPSFFFRRKPKDEKRLFICERRLRNPHAPRFSGPKSLRSAVAQYLPSRAYRLVTSSSEVRELHSYAVDVGAIIINMEIESRHDSAPILLPGALGLSLPPTPGGSLRVIYENPGVS
jgi:hypothetical protein